ncbi:MAG: DNA-binding protein WhiA [Peptococcaceae bacterium]|jgi:DNA-binding protein WhiA|nr:DNA-binding protein WhiA [Peptococcaceae bacterium]
MSFTAEVKEQLLRINTSKRCCREAEFLAFLRMSGNISLAAGGQAGILAASGNAAIARRYFKLVKELWQLRAEILMRDSQHFKKSRIYTLRIPPQEGVQRILLRMGGIPDGNPWSLSQSFKPGGLSVAEALPAECCRRAYLRGAFLGNGFVSDPKRSYHLEIVCQDMTQAHFLLALAAEYALTFKLAERKGRFLTYCKDSAQISDFLNVIGAHGALLQLENVKIIKDTSNNVNRVINCDTANTDKTIDAAQRQVQAIRRLADSPQGLAGLSPSLRETAALRLENPELSLLELARLFAKPISKAGLYHRLQKLEKLAEDL